MTWLVFTIIFALIAIIAFFVARSASPIEKTEDRYGNQKYTGGVVKLWAYGAMGVSLLLLLGITIFSSIHIIDAGHVGIIKTFGNIDGQVDDGAQIVAPWSDVIDVSTKADRKEFDNLAAFSKETQDVFVDATLNLAIAPEDVQCLYRTVGADWYDKLIPPRVLQTLKDETVKYSTTQVAPHREEIRRNVRTRLQQQLNEFQTRPGSCRVSIDVQDFLLRNIDFRPEFKRAIERKQIATQDAETARNRVAQKKFEADQKIAAAHGQAQSVLIEAQGQAKANRLLSHSLTQEIISYQYVQKLAPNIQAIVLGGSNAIIPSSFFKQFGAH